MVAVSAQKSVIPSAAAVTPSAAAVIPSVARDLQLIPVICGPTAAGKSAIAMWLAERHDITIISADSRQVYRGFDIGTNKPSRAEQKRVPHVGIDVADPTERYSAARWTEMARAAVLPSPISELRSVVVGGTGFYINSLFEPLWEEPELDPNARNAIQESLAEVSTDELRRWCAKLDPARSNLGRAQLLRAVEVALLTGKRLSDLHRQHARPSTFTPKYLVVDPGPSLASQIATRVEAMFDAGWVDETRSLMKSVDAEAPAWKACGYRTVREHAERKLKKDAAIEKITIETRQYAKRQRTWFRNQLPMESTTRVSPNDPDWQSVVEKWFGNVSVLSS